MGVGTWDGIRRDVKGSSRYNGRLQTKMLREKGLIREVEGVRVKLIKNDHEVRSRTSRGETSVKDWTSKISFTRRDKWDSTVTKRYPVNGRLKRQRK